MSASLVGSEMCIRDRCLARRCCARRSRAALHPGRVRHASAAALHGRAPCLLYTSDAADDM
eukprot:7027742-Alexandrium_andersonii.AAC.1